MGSSSDDSPLAPQPPRQRASPNEQQKDYLRVDSQDEEDYFEGLEDGQMSPESREIERIHRMVRLPSIEANSSPILVRNKMDSLVAEPKKGFLSKYCPTFDLLPSKTKLKMLEKMFKGRDARLEKRKNILDGIEDAIRELKKNPELKDLLEAPENKLFSYDEVSDFLKNNFPELKADPKKCSRVLKDLMPILRDPIVPDLSKPREPRPGEGKRPGYRDTTLASVAGGGHTHGAPARDGKQDDEEY